MNVDELVAIALAVLFALTDLLARRVPWFLSVPAAIAGVALSPARSSALVAAVLGAVLVSAAGFPGGDVKAAMALGAWLGLALTPVTLIVAWFLTLASWSWLADRQRPWAPTLAAALLLTLIAREVWRWLST